MKPMNQSRTRNVTAMPPPIAVPAWHALRSLPVLPAQLFEAEEAPAAIYTAMRTVQITTAHVALRQCGRNRICRPPPVAHD
jgi:hypothetical protein